MKKIHEIEKLDFSGEFLLLSVDGRSYQIRIADASQRLAESTDAQRRFFRISPSGYGIHWPEIDEDLSVDGLIELMQTHKAKSSGFVLREGEKE